MKRLIATLATLALLLLPTPAAAHISDNSAPDCTIYPYITIVAFQNYDETGAADDFCVFPGANWVYWDDNFSQNNDCAHCGYSDIGDHYLMNGYVSSLSLRNHSNLNATVWFYTGTNRQSVGYCVYMPAESHIHWNIGWPFDNNFYSLELHTSTTGC